MKNRLNILICLLIFTNYALADEIKGVIIDSETSQPIPLVNVIMLRTGLGSVADVNGRFTIDVKLNDTICFKTIAYHTLNVVIKNTDSLVIVLHPQTYYMNEVSVVADSNELPYNSTVFPEGDPPVIAAFVSPASYWYYKLSKKEKELRKYKSLVEYEQKMAKVMRIYNKALVQEFTGFEGQELEDCYTYCNANLELNEVDTEPTVKHKLLRVLTKYFAE